jgi:hypothetical protein
MLTNRQSGGIVSASGTTPNSSMTLIDLLAAYTASRVCSRRYEESLRRTTRKAVAYGLTKCCQLTPATVNEFLTALPVGPTTRHNIRRELLTLWKFAYEEGMTDIPPSRVRKIAARPAPPQAWSPSDLARLLRTADSDETAISRRVKLKVKDFIPAWITLGYETGLRLHDMLHLSADHYRNGCVAVRANKTGKVAVRRLSAESQRRLDALMEISPDKTAFLWAMPRRRAIKTWRSFLDRHKIPGSSKWLRRSAATQLEKITPGAAAAWLDHSNPALARRHYIDQTLLDSAPMPPTTW